MMGQRVEFKSSGGRHREVSSCKKVVEITLDIKPLGIHYLTLMLIESYLVVKGYFKGLTIRKDKKWQFLT